MAAVLNLRVSQRGTRVYSVLDAGFGLSTGFYCEGSRRDFRIFGSERRGEEYSLYSSRVVFSRALCCGELNMKVIL